MLNGPQLFKSDNNLCWGPICSLYRPKGVIRVRSALLSALTLQLDRGETRSFRVEPLSRGPLLAVHLNDVIYLPFSSLESHQYNFSHEWVWTRAADIILLLIYYLRHNFVIHLSIIVSILSNFRCCNAPASTWKKNFAVIIVLNKNLRN